MKAAPLTLLCAGAFAGCATPATNHPPLIVAPLAQPRGIAVDRAGVVYAGNFGNALVVKISPAARTAAVLAGTEGKNGDADGKGVAASFFGPIGLAVDGAGNVFVADSDSHTIRKISPDGTVTTLAGKALTPGNADGPGADARFDDPTTVAVDGRGNVYVGDNHNHTVRKISPTGMVTTLAGAAGQGGSVDGPAAQARFQGTRGIAVDGEGNVYVAAEGSSTIRKITPAGVVSTLAGQPGVVGSEDGPGTRATFNTPRAVAVDASGNVYVADTGNHLIRKITPAGLVSTLAGKAGESGNADGPGGAARFFGPRGVAVDGKGNLYIADAENDAVRMVTAAGMVTTLACAPQK